MSTVQSGVRSICQNESLIFIQAQSAGFDGGNLARITINGTSVNIEKNVNGNYRGLHLAIINPFNGNVESAQVFDTYKSSEQLDEFIEVPANQAISEGFIIVAACKDDCVTHLSQKAKSWFADMGSKEIHNLKYRQAFAFIGVSGKKEFQEKVSKTNKEDI